MSLSLLAPKAVICWCLAIASPLLAFGEVTLTPQGGEFSIAGALAGDQAFPQAAVDANGGYLVWQDNSVTTLGLRIRAERLGVDLLGAGPSFVVSSVANSKTTGDQEKPQVALLPAGGGAVVVWQGGKPGLQQIYARFIGPAGLPIKSDIRVSARSRNNQITPGVAVLVDGSIVIIWSSFGQDGSLQGVYGQRFSATGGKLGKEFQINQFTQNNQRTPKVAALSDGHFVVVWISELQPRIVSGLPIPSVVDAYARIFDASGLAVGNEFPVNTTSSNLCANPCVAGSPLGGFAVAWSQNDNVALVGSTGGFISGVPTARSTNSWDILGRLYGADGVATTDPFVINGTTYGDQYVPKLSASGAHYLAVWTSLGQDGSREGVYGRVLANDGSFKTPEFLVNTTILSRQIQPTVVSDGSGRFLTVWSSYIVGALNFDLLAQIYQLTGE